MQMSQRKKNVAFKIAKEDQDSQDSQAEDFAIHARTFSRFMKRGRFNQSRSFKKERTKRRIILMKFDVISARS